MQTVTVHNKEFELAYHYNEILASIKAMAKKINEDYKNKMPLFLSVLNGSFMVTSDIMKEINIPCQISFVKLSSYEGTHTTDSVKQLIGLKEDINGRDVVVIEDIVDTGNTLNDLYKVLKTKKPRSIKIATLLYKPDAYRYKHSIDYVGLQVPNDFLIGYGLDYRGLGRNLKHIYKIRQTSNLKLNIVLVGRPGSGKGTQAEKLINKYNLVHLGTGHLLRKEMEANTEIGKIAKQYINDGHFVPDEVVIDMISSQIDQNEDAEGFIFDGFPRNIFQAEALDKKLKEKNAEITVMLSLKVEPHEIIKRIIKRATDSGRADDLDEEIIKFRIKMYEQKTAPLKDYYKKQGKHASIDGMGDVEQIFNSMREAIQQRITKTKETD